MNSTLSIDKQIATRALEVAKKLGKSLNQVVHDDLEQLAGGARRSQPLAQFEERCLHSSGKLNGWHFDRNQANER